MSRESIDAERNSDLLAEHRSNSGLSNGFGHTIIHRTGPIDVHDDTVVLALDFYLIAKEDIFGHLVLVEIGHIKATSLSGLRSLVDRC